MKEKPILNEIMLSFTKQKARVFRNNVGMLEDKQGRKVRYGLCKGSSDLIGWKETIITPAMVGQKVAIFTAVEVKTGKMKATKEQGQFIDAVNIAGGIGMIVYSSHEAEQKLVAECGEV